MTKRKILRKLLESKSLVKIVGAHNGLSARLAEEAKFDGVWASSLEISATYALPDANILTMSQYLQAADIMNCATNIPVIADCNEGYGGVNNIIHTVREYERHGIAGICIEDKVFPKINSFSNQKQKLVSIEEFAEKVYAAKKNQTDPDFVVIARVEALIAGKGVEEAIQRAIAYEKAGADAILIHSKAKTSEEISQFMKYWNHKKPIIAIPTTYPTTPSKDLERMGIKVLIYANQGLRSYIKSLKETFQELSSSGELINIENKIASLDEVFALQQIDKWENI